MFWVCNGKIIVVNFVVLVDVLKFNIILIKLDLFYNCINDVGVVGLVEVFKFNIKLIELEWLVN